MGDAKRIVVVEDDPDIRGMVTDYLDSQRFAVTGAGDGPAMRRALAEAPADLVILDLNLPGESGLTLLEELRRDSGIAVIVLTGSGDIVDKVVGLELGADDYITKPFELRELLARVRSVLRRATPPASDGQDGVYVFSDWRLNPATRGLVSPEGAAVDLTTTEFNLLAVFVDHANKVLSRDRLLDLVHGRGAGPFDRSIDVQVGRLRRKIEVDPKVPRLIKTVRGAGYLFAGKVARMEESVSE
ncbi:MAG: response regulator [Alphaproteobacteria bacterium]